jgi:hypothetical protein
MKRTIWCRCRFTLTVFTSILSLLLITGCGPSGAEQLIKEYPWLGSLGLAFINGLLQQFGTDLPGLLVAAAAALVG